MVADTREHASDYRTMQHLLQKLNTANDYNRKTQYAKTSAKNTTRDITTENFRVTGYFNTHHNT